VIDAQQQPALVKSRNLRGLGHLKHRAEPAGNHLGCPSA
jgi:hypothetical protein